MGKTVSLFGDIVESLCCHPAYRMLSLRSVPQMPAASLDFTTFTWTAILRRLRQMQITGMQACSHVWTRASVKLCCCLCWWAHYYPLDCHAAASVTDANYRYTSLLTTESANVQDQQQGWSTANPFSASQYISCTAYAPSST